MAYLDSNDQKAYAKKHYEENKEIYKQRANESRKRRREINKQFVKEYLQSHPCVDCGNDDIRVLQFDHREMVGHDAKRVGHYITSRGRLEQEIAKCDVRCANCHMIRTAEQLGWSRELL